MSFDLNSACKNKCKTKGGMDARFGLNIIKLTFILETNHLISCYKIPKYQSAYTKLFKMCFKEIEVNTYLLNLNDTK